MVHAPLRRGRAALSSGCWVVTGSTDTLREAQQARSNAGMQEIGSALDPKALAERIRRSTRRQIGMLDADFKVVGPAMFCGSASLRGHKWQAPTYFQRPQQRRPELCQARHP